MLFQHGDKIQFLCKCSFLEIYNENVFDLLDAASRGLHLRENIKKGVFVDGIIEHPVTNASEAYEVASLQQYQLHIIKCFPWYKVRHDVCFIE